MTHFRANGKLLLTAEYSVLRGALALALPTRQGQTLHISPSGDDHLHWISKEANNETWFSAVFKNDHSVLKSSDTATAQVLFKIVRSAQTLNPKFNPFGFTATTKAEFNRAWGFGSSSSLVALIAQWAEVDALHLFFASQTGSGYDVAAALNDSPILYQLYKDKKAAITQTNFRPPFTNDLAFVYLDKKQKSDKEVARFSERVTTDAQINSISEITQKIVVCQDLSDFENLLQHHERLTSEMIGQRPIQENFFSDYPGVVKSLGAWGGDFVLATRAADAQSYFPRRGYSTVLSWRELFGF
jgi:mevalonate kinase